MEPHIKEEINAIVESLRSEGRCSEGQSRSLAVVFDRARFDCPPLDIRQGIAHVRAGAAGRRPAAPAFAMTRAKALLAAAALVMAAGAAALIFRAGDGGAVYEAIAGPVHGDVRFERKGRLSPLGEGTALGAGDTVLTGALSFAELRYRDELIVHIKRNSRFRIDELHRDGGGELRAGLELSSGTALFSFRKLGRGDVAEVRTPTSVAGVRGTSFGVSVSTRRDVRYEVLEGRINVRGRVLLDPTETPDEETRLALDEMEHGLAERAVAVEANEVCEVRASEVRALADKMERIVADLRLKSGQPDGRRIADAIGTMAAEAPPPRIYTSAESPPTLMTELRRLSGDLRGREEPERADVKQGGAGIFDRNEWMERTRASHILVDDSRGLFMAVGMDGRVDALRRGAVAWRFRCGSPILTRPVLDGGIIYLATADERIIALSSDNGKELWTRKVDGVLHFGARPAVDGNGLYLATAKGVLYRFNRQGREEWSLSLPAASYSTPVVEGRLLFVPLQDGRIHVIDTVLRIAVMRIDSGRIVGSSVIARNGRLYYANFEGVVACHNVERDETEWSHRVRGAITADPVVEGEYMYVVSSGGDVVKLSLGGHKLWSANLGGPVNRSPIVEGRDLYVLSRRVFYVFDTDRGTVQWSIVTPTESATNIAISGRTLYFGTEGNGIYQIRK